MRTAALQIVVGISSWCVNLFQRERRLHDPDSKVNFVMQKKCWHYTTLLVKCKTGLPVSICFYKALSLPCCLEPVITNASNWRKQKKVVSLTNSKLSNLPIVYVPEWHVICSQPVRSLNLCHWCLLDLTVHCASLDGRRVDKIPEILRRDTIQMKLNSYINISSAVCSVSQGQIALHTKLYIIEGFITGIKSN